MRVAYVDMTQPNQECPSGFTTITTPKRLCGRPGPRGCTSTMFSTNGFAYEQVCGKVIAYQHKTPDAQCPYAYSQYGGSRTIEGAYIDGVSLTHGSNPRKHVWTFIASHGEASTQGSCTACPCFSNFASMRVPFIGEDYFCDTGSRTSGVHIFYGDDPLWDGKGCGPTSNCCTFNTPPWFNKQLNYTTSDQLEMRICGNEGTTNEDVPVEHIELYVQ